MNVELFGVLAQLARGSEAVLAGVVSTGVQEVEVAHPLGGHFGPHLVAPARCLRCRCRQAQDRFEPWVVELGLRGHVDEKHASVRAAQEEVGYVAADPARHHPLQAQRLRGHLCRLSRQQQVPQVGEFVEALTPHSAGVVSLARDHDFGDVVRHPLVGGGPPYGQQLIRYERAQGVDARCRDNGFLVGSERHQRGRRRRCHRRPDRALFGNVHHLGPVRGAALQGRDEACPSTEPVGHAWMTCAHE